MEMWEKVFFFVRAREIALVNRLLSFSDLSLRGPLRWSFLLGLAGFDGFSVVLEVAAEELLEEY